MECLGASAPVLLAKRRARGQEVYNDLDRLWHNSCKMARDHGEELAQRIASTPYCRAEFSRTCQILKNWEQNGLDALGVARLHMVVVRQSYGATGRTWSRARPGGPDQAKLWSGLPRAILCAFDRLRGVHIECRDYMELLDYYDNPRTTFYLDPPYYGVEHEYYEVNRCAGFDHKRLRDAVENCKGSVVISYYAGEIEILYSEWRRVEKNVKICVGTNKRSVTELLFVKPSAYAPMGAYAGHICGLMRSTSNATIRDYERAESHRQDVVTHPTPRSRVECLLPGLLLEHSFCRIHWGSDETKSTPHVCAFDLVPPSIVTSPRGTRASSASRKGQPPNMVYGTGTSHPGGHPREGPDQEHRTGRHRCQVDDGG